MTNHIRITDDGTGARGKRVEIDGHDISCHVHRVRVDIEPRSFPEVELELIPLDLGVDVERARVQIDRENHDLLVRLGWTPPEGGSASSCESLSTPCDLGHRLHTR